MADRTVSVKLEAKYRGYVSGLEKAAASTAKLRTELGGLEKAAGGASTQMTRDETVLRDTARQLGVTSRETRKTSRETDRTSKSVSALAGEVAKAEQKVQALAKAFTRTGDRRALAGLKQAQKELSGLKALDKILPGKADGESAGIAVASGIGTALATSNALGKGVGSNPYLAAAVVAAVAAAAPAAGAALAAGLLAGVASAGLGVGIAAAAKDQKVQDAFSDLSMDAGKVFKTIGNDFKGPVLDAIGAARNQLKALSPDLRAALKPAAGYLAPLESGLAGLIEDMLPGLKSGIEDAAPVISVIAAKLPEIGEALGNLFETAGEHADEAASAMEAILSLLTLTIDGGAAFIGFLADAYVWVLKIGEGLGNFLGNGPGIPDDLGKGMEHLRQVAEGTTPAVGAVGSGVAKLGLELVDAGLRAAGVATGLGSMSDRTKVLNSSLSEGIELAGGFKQALDLLSGAALESEQAEINYQAAIDKVSDSIKENGRSLDRKTEKGRANRQALKDEIETIENRAVAAYNGAVKAGKGEEAAERAGVAAREEGRRQLVKSYMQYGKTRAQAEQYANSILGIPKNWSTKARLNVDEQGLAALAQLKREAEAFAGKNYTATARLNYVIHGKPFSGPSGIGGSNARGQRRGGVATPMAAGGIADVYPASNPPLYRYAEPETGGEAFIPKRGDRQRGRKIVAEAASWYGLGVTPMASGGIGTPFRAAASGLVNVAASSSTRTSRMDSTSSYLSARDSVGSLNQSLKDNGRSFSFATSKGRQNVSALFDVVKAAEESAKAKYDETGSVAAANRAYDEHITRLRRTLAQQKINASTTRQLLGYAVRPQFGTGGPQDSGANIAFAKSAISAASGLTDLKDSLSLNKASTSILTPEGQQNLTAIIGFLETASQAAQDKLSQTGSSKAASILYNTFVEQLQGALRQNGYTSAQINSLVRSYGRITLQPNAAGGVYGSGLSQAMALPPGETLYQWREPGTGGEAFVPRYGDRARSERILQVAAGWHGGSYTPAAQAGGGGATVNNNFTVHNNKDPLTLSTFNAMRREADARARVGFNR